MKTLSKYLLSLAALSTATAASAQTAVLYGLIDLGIASYSTKTRGSSTQMGPVQSGSRWGLRGTEDLGDGYRAIYRLENGFNAATGKAGQGGRMFGRAAWLGLTGPFGDLRLGRQTAVASDTLGDYEPFSAFFLISSTQTSLLPFNANRADNTVAYRSPELGGFNANISYSLDYGSAGTSITAKRSKLLSTAVQWVRPSYAVALTHERAYWAPGTTQAIRAQGTQPSYTTLAARTAVGPATLFGAVSLLKNGTTTGQGTSAQRAHFPSRSTRGAMVGMRWDFSSSALMAMASWQSAERGASDSSPQRVLSLGGEYSLSKRTNLYALMGRLQGVGSNANWREAQYAVGMRHRF